MHIGFKVWGIGRTPATLKAVAREAEEGGIHSLWVSETVSIERDQPRPYDVGLDPWTMIAFLAACTERVQIGSAVVIGPLLHPLILNSVVSSLDHLAAGRVMVGLGSGHRAEDFEATGLDFAKRGGMLRDQIAALRWLWTDPTTGMFESEHYKLKPLKVQQPYTPGGPPLLLSGRAPAAVRRAALMADGFVFSGGWPPEEIERVRNDLVGLRQEHRVERPFRWWYQAPGLLRTSAAEVKADVERLSEVGADGIIYQDPSTARSPEEAVAAMRPLREYLASR